MPGFSKTGETVIHEGHVIRVVEASFTDPDGQRFDREVVHHPGAVAVVPLLDDGATVVLVRQYRAAVEAELLEIPAGKLDQDGEAPEVAAARELAEEVGQRADQLVRLAEFHTTPGFSDERAIVYLGLGLSPTPSDAQGVEEQHMEIVHVSLSDVPAMVADGRLRDAKTIIGLALAREHLARRG